MNNKEYLKCPLCGANMIIREGPHGDFFGCTNFTTTGCKGSRDYSEGKGKSFEVPNPSYELGYSGRCIKCEQYPIGGELSSMGLCPSCQESFDDE